MISKIITQTYLKSFFKNWITLSFLLILFESLIHYLKETKLISEYYSYSSALKYISTSAFLEFFELAPMTLFAAIIITNWQWTQQRLWLACAVIGSSEKQSYWIAFIQIVLVSLMIIPFQFYIAPKIAFQSAFDRLSSLNKVPSIEIGESYLQHHHLFYPLSHQEIFIYDFDKKEGSFEPWQMKNQFTLAAKTADLDLSWSLYKQMGLNKLSLKEKLRLLETINKDNYRFSDLKNSLISDMNSFFLIFLSVVLGWKASPIQALKRSASLSTRKIVSYAMVLYTGLKILEVAINLLPLYFVLSLYCILILFCFI